jgi:hypothetical protein
MVRTELPKSISWAVYTSYFWFGFSGLCVNEFESMSLCILSILSKLVPLSHPLDKTYGLDVLKGMGMDDTNKYVSLACVLMMWFGLQCLAFFLLLFLNKEKR